MLQIRGDDIYRANEKIGWLQGNHIFDHEGNKLGYFEGTHIYDVNAEKIAYTEGNELIDETGKRKLSLDVVSEAIEGVLPEMAKCAIYVLLGN